MGQRVTGRSNNDVRMIAEDCAFQIEAFRRPPHDGEIKSQIPQCAYRLLAVSHREANFDPRMALHEGCQRSWREIFCSADHTDRNPPSLDAFQLGEFLVALGQKSLDAMSSLQNDVARGRRPRPLSKPFHERQAYGLFELLDLHRYSGRRAVQLT